MLNGPFSKKKIRKGTFDLGKLKTLGLDGFQVGFYQNYWDIIDKKVVEAMLEFFEKGSPIKFLNQTFYHPYSKNQKS